MEKFLTSAAPYVLGNYMFLLKQLLKSITYDT
jgi:hypothetical protein